MTRPKPANAHDQDFGGLDDPDDPGLVAPIGKLSGQRGEEKERQDENARCNGVEDGFFGRIRVDRVGDEHHHRGLVEVVVKGVEELRDEKGQKIPPCEEPEGWRHKRS